MITSRNITDDDLRLLNGLQVNHSVNHVFSAHCCMKSKEDWERIQGLVEMEKPDRWIDETNWKTGFISIASPFITRLTFMKEV